MIKWELKKVPEGKMLFKIEDDGKVWAVPQNEANSDYQAYLRWLENPNEQQGANLND